MGPVAVSGTRKEIKNAWFQMVPHGAESVRWNPVHAACRIHGIETCSIVHPYVQDASWTVFMNDTCH